MRSRPGYRRRLVTFFASIIGVVILLESLFFGAELYFSSLESRYRRTLATAEQLVLLVEKYERATYLSVSALATSDWELLIAQRREAEELDRQFRAIARALGAYPTATRDMVGDGAEPSAPSGTAEEPRPTGGDELRSKLVRASSDWERVATSQVRLLRANNHGLRDNPALTEFRTRIASLRRDLGSALAALQANHSRQSRRLNQLRIAVPIALLLLTLGIAAIAFRGLVMPLGTTMDKLQASREELEGARDSLEERISGRTRELSQINQDLKRQGELLTSVLDSMGEGLLVATPNGSVQIWNAEAEKLLGAQPEDASLEAWSEACESFHQDGITPVEDGELPIQQALAGVSVATELLLKTTDKPDGLWLSWSARPLAAAGQRSRGAVAVFRDVTRRKEAEDRLSRAHDELERRVETRTRELREAQKQLVDSALAAGKAEVATNILHNVGNVLNGVNVLAQITRERLEIRQWQALQKVAELIDRNRDDLGRFLSEDSTGKQLPDYLLDLAGRQQSERLAIIERIERMAEQIEHIKRIVQMQQTHAKAASLNEETALAEVLETAIEINLPGLERHSVRIVRELDDVPPMTMQKHKLLQILVNLISNAKYAMADVARDERELTLRLLLGQGSERVRIEVADNGCGIAPELLTRIFQHGFSTRREGHGFGLHASVLAANQLGGTLSGQSDGVGRGATFILELPIAPARDVSIGME